MLEDMQRMVQHIKNVVSGLLGSPIPIAKPPPPLPDFRTLWVFRWIREDVMNQDDKPYYYDSKLEKIWQPCKVKDHPEFWPEDDDDFQDFINEKDNVKFGGLVLCKSLKDKMDKQPRDSRGRFLPKTDYVERYHGEDHSRIERP